MNLRLKKEKFEIKLEKLYLLNKKKPEKLNDNLIKLVADPNLIAAAYRKIQFNKSDLMIGVSKKNIACDFNFKFVKDISKSILNETYEWKEIKKIIIQKSEKRNKRSLEILTFSDKIVQECIKAILTTIYEPNFQIIEANYGFRPQKTAYHAIDHITTKGQGMEYALEGNVFFAYNSFRHKKLIELLKKRINDKKFLRLIEKSLKYSLKFNEKKVQSILGVFQETILSPLLLNIYMHEFDLEIEKVKREVETINKKEKRFYKAYSKVIHKFKVRIIKLRKDLNKKLNDKVFIKFEFKKLIKKIETSKKQLLVLSSIDKAKTLLKLEYFRYADNWIIFSNTRKKNVLVLKERLTTWLKDNLYLELNQEETCVKNLRQDKARFLGFTLFLNKKKTIRKKTKTGKIFRQRSEDRIYLGIDHERVKNKMKDLKIINEKLQPRHVDLDCSLRPWEIVEKFSLKTLGLLNYYYPHLSSLSDLSYYYYAFKYSCLKTLSFRLKISMVQVSKIYGEDLKMKKVILVKDKVTGMIKEKKLTVSFPNYLNMMDQVGNRIILRKAVKIPKISAKILINGFKQQLSNPLGTLNISMNTINRTKKVCNNPIEMHT